MIKANKMVLGLSTLIMAGILSHTTQVYAYYDKKKITIHPVNSLGEEIHNNIELEVTVVKSSNPDDWYIGWNDPEISGYKGTDNRIEYLSDFKTDKIVITEPYEYIGVTRDTKSWAYENGNWYYRTINGVYSYAWEKINYNWYFFDIETAAMKKDYWVRWKDKWYYMKSDGTMAINTYIGGYYVDSNGEWIG